ncbi:MAG: hypothetical protein HFH36_14065 [Lachnospiraceae bacterium]|nr:hypothetical protein [Lachnospiraceae bacterium]MCI9448458.1 hypothetical protein [Lachnospiraceae bacterium]
MDKYKVTVLRLGQARVMAETKEAADLKAQNLPESEIVWLSETDGLSGKYLVTFVELEKD